MADSNGRPPRDTEDFIRVFAARKWPKPGGGVFSERTYRRLARKFNIQLIPCGSAGPIVDPDDAEVRIKEYAERLREARLRKAGRARGGAAE
jgi:hypothetical protein